MTTEQKLKDIRDRLMLKYDGDQYSTVEVMELIQQATYNLGRDEEQEIILEFIAKEIYGSNEEDREHIKEKLKMFKEKHRN